MASCPLADRPSNQEKYQAVFARLISVIARLVSELLQEVLLIRVEGLMDVRVILISVHSMGLVMHVVC